MVERATEKRLFNNHSAKFFLSLGTPKGHLLRGTHHGFKKSRKKKRQGRKRRKRR